MLQSYDVVLYNHVIYHCQLQTLLLTLTEVYLYMHTHTVHINTSKCHPFPTKIWQFYLTNKVTSKQLIRLLESHLIALVLLQKRIIEDTVYLSFSEFSQRAL